MGYIRGIVHGTVAGTIVGICIAPQPGKRTREQLSAFGNAARESYGLAEKTYRQVAPLAGAAVHIIRGQFGQAKRERHEDEFGIDANVTIHNQTHGRH